MKAKDIDSGGLADLIDGNPTEGGAAAGACCRRGARRYFRGWVRAQPSSVDDRLIPEIVPRVSRRRMLGLLGTSVAAPLLAPFLCARAADPQPDLRFRALRKGSPIGVHTVTFRMDGDRLVVNTHIDIEVKVLVFTAYYLKHDAEEVWQAGRLLAVRSTTDDNGTQLRVSGAAVAGGFRIQGGDGPFLAPAQLLTSNMLWDIRFLGADRLIDVQHGGVIGLVVRRLGDALADTPRGQVRASRHHVITPHYAGTLFHDSDGRWVKALIEAKGEIIEYAFAT